jgi:hypothetical protein
MKILKSESLKMTRLKSRQKTAEYSSMSLKNTEWKFLVTTAFLVATIAIPTLASLMTPDEVSPQMALVLRPTELKVRQPASLPSVVGAPKKSIVIQDTKRELNNLLSNNLISYDFACNKTKVTDFHVEGGYLQLKGKDCSKGSHSTKLSITNKSNGFTAAVFMLNEKEYQTDLIQLQEGENQISIQYQTPSGQIEEYLLKVKAGAI